MNRIVVVLLFCLQIACGGAREGRRVCSGSVQRDCVVVETLTPETAQRAFAASLGIVHLGCDQIGACEVVANNRSCGAAALERLKEARARGLGYQLEWEAPRGEGTSVPVYYWTVHGDGSAVQQRPVLRDEITIGDDLRIFGGLRELRRLPPSQIVDEDGLPRLQLEDGRRITDPSLCAWPAPADASP